MRIELYALHLRQRSWRSLWIVSVEFRGLDEAHDFRGIRSSRSHGAYSEIAKADHCTMIVVGQHRTSTWIGGPGAGLAGAGRELKAVDAPAARRGLSRECTKTKARPSAALFRTIFLTQKEPEKVAMSSWLISVGTNCEP